MTRSRAVSGHCLLCGEFGGLSFEHVPPRSAFNDKKVLVADFEAYLNQTTDRKPRGKLEQRGAGGYTLCGRCNSVTGKWYTPAFASWCHQGMRILLESGGKPSLYYFHWLFPLRVIKQIVTMFFSVNGLDFQKANPDLVEFVLNRDKKYLAPRHRYFVYYNIEGWSRRTGISSSVDLRTGLGLVSSEISYPPFGYVQTFGDRPREQRMFEITHFARYDYEQFEAIELRLPLLPTNTPLPGDYRAQSEVLRARDIPQGNV